MTDTSLDQEEVWDDTALVDSWNEAFAEYKVSILKPPHSQESCILMALQKYHSIAAKGGKVSPPPAPDEEAFTNGNHPTESMEQTQHETVDSDEYAPSVGQASKSGQSTGNGTFTAPAAPSMPQALAANSKCSHHVTPLVMGEPWANGYDSPR